MRAPSQAAINAAILAAQRAAGTAPSVDDDDSSDFFSDEEEDEEDEGSSEGEEAPAAAGGKKAGEGGGGGGQASGARLQTNRVLTPEEFILGELAKQAGGVSVHTQATWPGAAMLVLTKARRAAAVGWVAAAKANPVCRPILPLEAACYHLPPEALVHVRAISGICAPPPNHPLP